MDSRIVKIMKFLGSVLRSGVISPVHPGDPALVELLRGGRGAMTAVGIRVSESTALSLAASKACISIIAETCMQAPLMVVDRTKGERLDTHRLNTVLQKPNAHQTGAELIETLILNKLIGGRGVAKIIRDASLRPIEIIPFHWKYVHTYLNKRGELLYEVSHLESSKVEILMADEVIDIRGPSLDGGITCLTPVEARETFGIAAAADNFTARFYNASSALAGTLNSDEDLSDKTYERLKEWQRESGGLQGVPVFPQGIKYNALVSKPSDAQIIETKKMVRSEIAALYRVPLRKIAGDEAGSTTNVEQDNLALVLDAAAPHISRIEPVLTNALLTPRERSRLKIEMDMNALLRADFGTRSEVERRQWSTGSLSSAEIRANWGRKSREGTERFYVPANMVPIDRVDDVINNNPGGLKSEKQGAGEETSVEGDTGISN